MKSFFLLDNKGLSDVLNGSYEPVFVVVSVLISILAAYASFKLSINIKGNDNRITRVVWYCTSAISLGVGVWAMHFIGMLAFRLPVNVNYDTQTTMISLVPAILASAIVLRDPRSSSLKQLLVNAVLMGSGIGTMHYTGMAAMQFEGHMSYHPGLFFLSIITAVALSAFSLRVKQNIQQEALGFQQEAKIITSAIAMGVSISGMHYIAMSATYYFADSSIEYSEKHNTSEYLVWAIAIAVIFLFFCTVIASIIGRRLSLLTELKESEERFKSIINNTSEAIITINGKGNIELFNPAAEKYFAYTQSEILGKNISFLIPETERKHHDEYVTNSTLHSPKIINRGRDLIGRKKDGSTFHMELTVSPISINGKQGFVGIARDITQRKLTEKLKIEKETAEKANLAKTEFIGNMSHELRTPIHGVLSFSKLGIRYIQQQKNNDEKLLNYFKKIIFSATKLHDLVSDILDISYLNNDKFQLNISTVNFSALVVDCIDILKVSATNKNQEVSYNYGLQDPVIQIDANKIKQVIINLLTNAISYSPENTAIEILVEEQNYSEDENGGKLIQFCITDQGVGIPPNELETIFDCFTQSTRTKTGAGGTGLGLAICKEIIESHHGKIWAENNPAEGATFKFIIPI